MEGGEVMTVLQVAMMGKLPYTVMRDGIFAHPAWAESLNNLFMSMDGQGLHGEKRSKCAVRGALMARLLSVNVGLPRDIVWRGRTVHTGVWKDPVQGRRMARRLNIDGDGQGDLEGHGGEQRAVLVYQIESYRYWEDRLRRSDLTYGQFGENRVGIRMNEPQMAALLTSSGKPRFCFRVLQEGEVEAGDEIVKVADGPERLTIAEINALLYLPGHSRQQLERALRIAALSPGWRTSFRALLQNESSGSPMTGNPGLSAGVGALPAWAGFRPLRVSRIDRESSSVVSLLLAPADGRPLVAAETG